MGQFSLFDTDEFVQDEVFLFFDTETNGLPYDFNAPVTDTDNWPRMIQLAWIQHDAQQNELSRGDYLVYPDNFYIHESIHGITNDQALAHGRPAREVLDIFQAVLAKTTVLVAHNISFDEKIMGAEFVRHGMPNPIPELNKICTMQSSVDFCAIKSGNRFKFPKLEELHHKLFEKGFAGAHNAMNDVEALVRCFWSLKTHGVVSLY
ncbi:MAG: 3'-5' exonuclease [Candidatus Sericytochromatia bacterium]